MTIDPESIPDETFLAEASTDSLKALLLKLVESRDEEPIGQKVRFANEGLLPLFGELERRNPTPDVEEQISLVRGVWSSVWSTIPFQDILPGRLRDRSYQIFADNGFYANLARYKPGSKTPILNKLSRWLLSYDLMIIQTYSVGEDSQWNIENIGIRQKLRFASPPLTSQAAETWFDREVENYLDSSGDRSDSPIPTKNTSRATNKRYQKVFKARPELEHLYMDRDFRLVKTRREKSQRPSYTVAVRL